MAVSSTKKILYTALMSVAAFAALVLIIQPASRQLLGRVLEGEELTRVQVESDFDRDGDIDFQDFTVFAAFYEEE